MATPKKKSYPKLVSALVETFGLNPIVATVLILLMTAVVVGSIVWFVRSAPPRTLVITSVTGRCCSWNATSPSH